MSVRWHLKHKVFKKPREVQVEAMRRSEGKNRYGYFLEQGLAKTSLMLNKYMDSMVEHYDTLIVVGPNAFKMDWTLAPEEWGLDFSTSMWPKQDFKFGTTSRPHLNSINFEAIRTTNGHQIVADMMEQGGCALIIDESSAIKNFKSDTYKAVSDLAKLTKGILEANGTPLVQNVMDLYPQLKVLGELNGWNPYAFRNRYAVMGGYMGKQVVGFKNEAELNEIQERVTFRALKKDWWKDCPEKLYPPLHLEMTNNQRKHYADMWEFFITSIQDEEIDAPMVLAQMEKLRQIASGLILNEGKAHFLDEPAKNPKIKAALDVLESGPGKMIDIYFYNAMGDAIYEFFKKKGLEPARIQGGMKPEEIVREKKRFNGDKNCRVLVGQIVSTHEAHTLIGDDDDNRCNKMYFHDQTFNKKHRAQCEDRIHRGVQDRNCLYFDPILAPIDQIQIDALKSKQEVINAVVDKVRAMPRKNMYLR